MTTIATSQAQMGLATNQIAAQNLQEKTRNITSLQNSLIPQIDKDKKLRGACEGFETIFVKKMWEDMQATVQKSDFLTSRDEQHWRGMYNQELAEVMTSAGGIGLADMMYRQLSGDLANASKATIATSFNENSTGFELKPVPLINSSDIGENQSTNKVRGINEQILANIQVAGNATDIGRNNKSMYSGEANQPSMPNLNVVHNQSVQNAHDAIANMNTKNFKAGNSDIIQNVLTQLKSQKIGINNTDANAKNTINLNVNAKAVTEQNSAGNYVYVADRNNKQQNHIMQQGVNAQPERNTAYAEPIINKFSGGAVLPNASTGHTERAKLPKQSGINQTQVHGSPGISPSQYINNSPFVVHAPTIKTESQDKVVDKQTQTQTQNFVSNNAQVTQMEEIGQTLTRQNFNILPSERKTKNI